MGTQTGSAAITPVIKRNFSISEGIDLNFVLPSVSNGVYRAVVDKEEVSSLKLSWKATCAMFVVGYQPSLSISLSFLRTIGPLLET